MEWERERSFRIYLTDAAMLICENTARIGGGQLLRRRWADAAYSQRSAKQEDASAVEEVLTALRDRAGVRIVG